MAADPHLLPKPFVNAWKQCWSHDLQHFGFTQTYSPKTVNFSKAGPIRPGLFPLPNHDNERRVFIYPMWVELLFSHPIFTIFRLLLFLSLKCSEHIVFHQFPVHSRVIGQVSMLRRHRKCSHHLLLVNYVQHLKIILVCWQSALYLCMSCQDISQFIIDILNPEYQCRQTTIHQDM